MTAPDKPPRHEAFYASVVTIAAQLMKFREAPITGLKLKTHISDAERRLPVPAIHVARIPFPRESAAGPVTMAYLAALEKASAAAAWLHRVHCGLTGHDLMLQFESARLSLRCHGCGEETPGWSIG